MGRNSRGPGHSAWVMIKDPGAPTGSPEPRFLRANFHNDPPESVFNIGNDPKESVFNVGTTF